MNTASATRLIGAVITSAILASAALMVGATPAAAASATPDAPLAAAAAAPGVSLSDTVAGLQPTTPVTVFDGAVASTKTVTFDVMDAIGVPAYDVDAVVLQVRARTTTKASAATVWSAGARPANASMLIPAASDRAQTMLVRVGSVG